MCPQCLKFVKEAGLFRKMAAESSSRIRSRLPKIEFVKVESQEGQVDAAPTGIPERIGDLWKCCGKLYKRRMYQHHKAKMHPEQKKARYLCRICRKKFDDKGSLTAHNENEKCVPPRNDPEYNPKKVNGTWECCGAVYENYNVFYKHKRRVHPGPQGNRTCFCPVCRAKFEDRKFLSDHKKSGECKPVYHEFNPKRGVDGVWECCGKRFLTEPGFSKHKRNIHPDAIEEKECTCKCGEKFRSYKLMFIHKKECDTQSQFVDGQWKCCDGYFSTDESLQSHKEEYHVDEKKPTILFCRNCHHKFDNIKSLLEHKNKGHCKPAEQAPVFNPIMVNGMWYCCGVTFAKRHSFSHHKITIHPDALQRRLLSCPTCGAQFKQGRAYKEHRKNANCLLSIDNSGFDPKPGKSYYRKCCGKEFTRSAFYSHKETFHPEQADQRPFNCATCFEEIKGRKELIAHYKTFHPKKP